MRQHDITTVIPAREGSRRLRNKNVAPFAVTNLLLNKIEQLKKVKEVSRIVVSSGSDMMLAMAREVGVLTHKRGAEYYDERTKTFGEVVRHVAESIEGEHILWATCTSPLLFSKTYRTAIAEYFSALKKGFDFIVSFEVIKRYLWDEKGPVNYELGNKDATRKHDQLHPYHAQGAFAL